jgi:hypothetical protein
LRTIFRIASLTKLGSVFSVSRDGTGGVGVVIVGEEKIVSIKQM